MYSVAQKLRARTLAAQAVLSKRLKVEPCAECGSTDRIEAHHPDYGKPLDVVWLCRKHHKARHPRLQPSDLPKDIRKQVLLSREDVRILVALRKKYGSSDSEIIRRGLRCLLDKESENAPKKTLEDKAKGG